MCLGRWCDDAYFCILPREATCRGRVSNYVSWYLNLTNRQDNTRFSFPFFSFCLSFFFPCSRNFFFFFWLTRSMIFISHLAMSGRLWTLDLLQRSRYRSSLYWVTASRLHCAYTCQFQTSLFLWHGICCRAGLVFIEDFLGGPTYIHTHEREWGSFPWV